MAKKQTNIEKRRRLADLYVEGAEVRFGPDGVIEGELPEGLDEGQLLTVWVQPPNQLQREHCLREAQAARARAILNARRDEDSNESLSTRSFLAGMAEDDLIEYVLDFGNAERQREATRDVLAKEEWSDFTELSDAMRQWEEAGSPRTEEWQALIERDEEYGRQVDARARELRAAAEEALRMMSREELEKQGFERRIETVGTQMFMSEYELQMLFHACRDDENHTLLFFEHPSEIKTLHEAVQRALAEAYAGFIQDGATAKNSPRAGDGSEPSLPPEGPETSEASTPEVPNE